MPLPLSDPSHIINKLTSHIINKLTKDNSSSFKTMSLFNIKKKKKKKLKMTPSYISFKESN